MDALVFEHVTKQYRRSTPRQSLGGALRRLSCGSGHAGGATEFLYALRDVSFEVKAGEAFGIIGGNGAGKTTTLKIIAGITRPSAGRIRGEGRVASLIELGAGFHPELTGRENLLLNGVILGLSRAEIRRRLDDIVAFAELEEFIDQPVKHYSSGMVVRLAFAIAVHVDAETLLLDEVLAVGDARFQQRSMERMRGLRDRGVTFILVSHNLPTVASFCARALWLDRGVVAAVGPTEEAIGAYVAAGRRMGPESPTRDQGDLVHIRAVRLHNARGEETSRFRHRDDLVTHIACVCDAIVHHPRFTLTVRGPEGRILQASHLLDGREPAALHGSCRVTCRFPGLPLAPGSYHIVASVRAEDGVTYLMHPQIAAVFVVEDDPVSLGWTAEARPFISEAAPVVLPYEWAVTQKGEDGLRWP